MIKYWLIGLGGIGQALEQALQDQSIKVETFSRHSNFDVMDEHAIDDYIQSMSELPDVVIITTGMLSTDTQMPEKSIKELNLDWLNKSIEVNLLPTLYFAKSITKRISHTKSIILASFTARVSSINDNKLGGWYSYRMSKTMLNMLIKNIAIEWRFKSPNSIIFGYHPGTVDTPLSKPFQKSIKAATLLKPPEAAQYFLDCLNSRTISDSGKIFDWQQKEILP